MFQGPLNSFELKKKCTKLHFLGLNQAKQYRTKCTTPSSPTLMNLEFSYLCSPMNQPVLRRSILALWLVPQLKGHHQQGLMTRNPNEHLFKIHSQLSSMQVKKESIMISNTGVWKEVKSQWLEDILLQSLFGNTMGSKRSMLLSLKHYFFLLKKRKRIYLCQGGWQLYYISEITNCQFYLTFSTFKSP